MKPTKKLQKFVSQLNKAIHGKYSVSKAIQRKHKLTFLGSGISRGTYKSKDFPGVVFKVEFSTQNTPRTSPNNSEYSFYNKATKKQKQFLSAAIYISKDCRILVMEETPQIEASCNDIVKFLKRMTKVIPYNRRWDTESVWALTTGWWGSRRRVVTPHNIGTAPSGGFKLFDYATQATTC